MIPLFATREAIEPLLPLIAERQRAVLESGRYVLGPEVEAFEAEFAGFVGRRHCVGVASGTDALTIALRALGIGGGGEVVVPAMTFFASAEAVIHAGARPVFCDIDPDTYCMTAETAAAALTPRTRAILPVHLFGNPAPMNEISELARSRDLLVVEDAAQAAGGRLGERMAGAFGDVSCFSFYPGKPLGGFGDGGAILTDDDAVAERARRLRDHAASERWVHEEAGYNSRLDELQAAALRVLLPEVDAWAVARRRVADGYRASSLSKLVTLPTETPEASSAWHLHVVLAEGRDELIWALAEDEIEARAYYTTPMHLQPALREFSPPGALPNAERLASEGVALPMGPSLSDTDVAAVAAAVEGAVTAR
jgi:dTDP-4-amino-4,6-dideoxygalactose transaminase